MTLREVAEKAEVSTATVSYVLAGRRGRSAGASGATEARIRRIAAELGYRPNQAARTVRTGRTGVLLLSLNMLSDPWSQSVVDAVVAASDTRRHTALVLGDADWTVALDRVEADVAFIDGADERDLPRLRSLSGRMRLVVFSETLEPDGFDVVRSEDLPGCRIAVDHLLERHERIGCLTSVGADGVRGRRYGVWEEAMVAAGLPHTEDLVAEYGRDSASAFAATMDLLSRPERPTALYATTDFAAMAAVSAAQRLRLDVPGDLAVIGVGNASATGLASPSVSSVGPRDLFASLAALMLRRAEGDDGPPQRHDFAWELFARESTATTVLAPGSPDPDDQRERP